MRAMLLLEHGGNDKIVFDADFPTPDPKPNEVRVRVRSCAINFHDVFTRRGMPGIKVPMPMVMGLDIAGEVDAAGADVSGWSAGERVLVDPIYPGRGLMGEMLHGGLAEFCVADASQLIRLPDSISFDAAATLPVAYGTAYRMLRTVGAVQPGERVLILGASGGVGTASVMLAKLFGADVIACAAGAKGERLRALGADYVIDYTAEDFAAAIHARFGKPHRKTGQGGVDVVVNFTGGDTWVRSLKVLRRGGRLLTCGATAGYDPPEDIRYIWAYELKVVGSNGWDRGDLNALVALCEEGRLSPLIDRVLPLARAAEAIELLERREIVGKVLVAP